MPTRLFAPPDGTRLPLALPAVVPEPTPPGFPFLAALAPVVGAVVLWSITQSMISLAFAVLGPVLAVATVLDGRRQARRSVRRANAERIAAFARLRAEVAVRHREEAETAWLRHPSSGRLVSRDEPPEWRARGLAPVVLGAATVESVLRIDGSPSDDLDRAALDHARRLEGAPVVVDLAGGVGFAGPTPLVRAAARAVLVQTANLARPDAVAFDAPDTEVWRWVARFPHEGSAATLVLRDLTLPVVPGAVPGPSEAPAAAGGVVALATDQEQLPPGLAFVVRIDGPRTATLLQHGAVAGTALAPDLLGAEESCAWAERSSAYAERAGLGPRASVLPEIVRVRDLPAPAAAGLRRSTLRAAVGLVAGGALEVDLVADGPHAIVAGTTGSGKSEFLLAWILQMAAAHPPERVGFLLVDFKGGSAFEPIAGLPHVAGIVTDLDDAEAERAVLSLAAELRHRERVLRGAGVRDIGDLADDVPLGRLVVVIDEFQAMIQRFRGLGSVVADIAARGRSLGVHLVLASQRPNGVLGEQITANAPIRVSLRVMTRADSLAVVGSDAAAGIPADRPGRGIADRGDGVRVPFQSVLVDAEAVDEVRRRFAASPPVRRPWLDPLPTRLARADLEAALGVPASDAPASPGSHGSPGSSARRADSSGGPSPVVFGIVDEPDLQRRSPASWTPAVDGNLLVLGSPGAGRSTALAAIEAGVRAQAGASAVLRLGRGAPTDWQLLADLVTAARGGSLAHRLLVVDDLDTRFAPWPEEYRHAATAMLAELLADGRRLGFAVAAGAALGHRLGGGLRELFGEFVHLRHPSKAELSHAGGVGDLWQRDAPPGSGQWRSRRLQVIDVPPLRELVAPGPPPEVALDEGFVALVSSAAQRDLDLLRATGRVPVRLVPGGEREVLAGLGREPLLVVGDADAWAASYALAARARDTATILVRGGLREFRALAPASAGRTGPIALPPLLGDGGGECWAVRPGGSALRRRWPTTENIAYHVSGH
ncbi:FtsK/SpoIIIE domain-containing protein [Agromyces allii]|uniref:FtsK domain-containing protein n=1 Tax=Agromyces allii TaxID=393607 RepID=A0ABP5BIB5_9MICO|nr:FtsK/SpoIIIE domain-containing protein [Agromyces allii]